MKNQSESQLKYKINSYKLRSVLSSKSISSSAKLVLLNLISRLGTKKHCWPSQITIAKDLGLSDRQVRNLLDELHQKEIIIWKRGCFVPNTDRKTRSNKYDLSYILTPSLKKDIDEQKQEDKEYEQLIREDES